MGRPVPGYDVNVVDDDGEPVDARRGGEHRRALRTRTPGRAVPRLPQRPRRRRPTRSARPFYFTGDKAAIDEDGYFWFEGRDDDVITSSAYRIGPFEVESALVEHPAVMEAAVVGKDDPERTQIVTAFCILAPGYDGITRARHASCRTTSSAPPLRTSTPARSTSSTSCPRPSAARSAAPSCAVPCAPDKTTARRSVSQVHHPPEIP